jgi:hypothetical protein
MRLSKPTLFLASYIIGSAIFANQVWDFLAKAMGQQNIRITVSALFIASALFVLILEIRSGFKRWKVIFSLAVVTVAILFAWNLPFFVERIHVMQYGLMGWLVARDLGKNDKSLARLFFRAILIVLLIASLDEILQKFLPYRVGDIRDVITDAVGGIFGIVLFLLKLV